MDKEELVQILSSKRMFNKLISQKEIGDDSFISLLEGIDSGRIRLEEPPLPETGPLSKENFRENLKTLLSQYKVKSKVNIAPLVEEAATLISQREEDSYTDADESRLQEIGRELREAHQTQYNKKLKRDINYILSVLNTYIITLPKNLEATIAPKMKKLRENIKNTARESRKTYLEEKIRELEELSPQNMAKDMQSFAEFTIKTEKIGETEKKIPLGRVQGNEIVTNFKDYSEFSKFLRGNEELKALYNEKIRPYGTAQITGTVKTEKNSPKQKVASLSARNVVFQSIEFTSKSQVDKYLEIVGGLQILVGKFVPSEMKRKGGTTEGEGGKTTRYGEVAFLPSNFILTPQSAKKVQSGSESTAGLNTIRLNPYANIILGQSFITNWFSLFFRGVRFEAGTKEETAKTILIEDITAMLMGIKEKSKFGFDEKDFPELNLDGTYESNKSKVRDYISTDRELLSTFNAEIDNYRDRRLRDALSFSEKGLSRAEGKRLKDNLPAYKKIYDKLFNDNLKIELVEMVELDKEDDIPAEEGQPFDYYAIDVLDTPDEDDEPDPEAEEKYDRYTPAEFIRLMSELVEEGSEMVEEGDDSFAEAAKKITPKLNKIKDILGGDETDFQQYLLSFNKSELEDIVKKNSADNMFYIEKLEPRRSLEFFVRMNERMVGDSQRNMVGESLLAMAGEKETEARLAIANELNEAMPQIIDSMKNYILEAFTVRLRDFGKNYSTYSTKKPEEVLKAIEEFKEAGLLTGGE